MKKTWQDHGREWLDTLVVAISVAMAFRAYFYEPFNIPTGSMQPTLYGNHSESCENPGVWQKTPLKWLDWILSGRDYKEFVAPFDGVLCLGPRNDGRFNLFVQSPSGARSEVVAVPTDLKLLRVPLPETRGAPIHVKKGDLVLSGYDVTGDFIFVNRWKWNFRAPKRGDVAVFSTEGVGLSHNVQQGTHYIKRLTALPGETVAIEKPDVFINGEKIPPLKPMTGARGEKTPEPNAGGPKGLTEPLTLGEGEYFVCGDNSDNSLDSRYWGAVPERNLKGTGALVFWPIINPRWGGIK